MSDTTHRPITDDGYLTFAFADARLMVEAPDGMTWEVFAARFPDVAEESEASAEWWWDHLRLYHGIDDNEIDGFIQENTYPLQEDEEGRLVHPRLGTKRERRPEFYIRGNRDIHAIAHGEPGISAPGTEGLPMLRPHTHSAQEALRAVIDNSWIPDFMKDAIYEMAWYLNSVGGGGVPNGLSDD